MEDCILVSYVDRHEKGTSVLLVGRKRLNESAEIINAFEGLEADAIYQRLITKKEKKGDGKVL